MARAQDPEAVGRAESSAASLDNRLAEVARLDLAGLRAQWATLFARQPPKSLARRLLLYAVAYQAQAKFYGGLKPAVRRRLLQAAKPRPGNGTSGASRRPALPPGSRLVREWRGRSHTVEVTQQGFFYVGKNYRSLSEVARTITGARWSGPRFFGL